MRRATNLWPRVVAFDNLLAAAERASLGKRGQASVARFRERRETEVLSLQRELEEDRWRPGHPTYFEVQDPKRRTITAAPFRDRVVHHALIDPLEPVFDRRMVFESFACRRGKGTHAALRHAQRLVRRHRYFLKLDVRRFFASVQRPVVLTTLERIVKDRAVLRLCARVLGDNPVGLPIGNLTSQWFANLILDRLDHHVKEVLRIPGYVRYMDDFVLFVDDKARLQEAHDEVAAFLAHPLRLVLKHQATQLAPVTEGLPFLGWRIHPGTLRLRPENRRRTLRRLRLRSWQHRHGEVSTEQWHASVRSVLEHLRHGNTLGLRRCWIGQRFLHTEP